SILKGVAFPWHECHLKVSTKSKLSVLCCITFTKHLAFYNPVTFSYNRLKVYTGTLVGFPELDQLVCFLISIKAYASLTIGPVMLNSDLIGIYIFNSTTAFGIDKYP